MDKGSRCRSRAGRQAVVAGLCAWLALLLPGSRPASAQDPGTPAVTTTTAPGPSFAEWLATIRAEALAQGIGAATVEAALGQVEPLSVVVTRDRTQAELTLTLDQYLKRRLTPRFVKTARATARQHRGLLRRVERTYDVPASVVAAVWGLESHFGKFSGLWPTVPALATLTWEGRRAELFKQELFAALRVVDRGDVPLDRLKGSWAGAMGQPQFMPSSYASEAVDFDGDGQRDIWSSTPDVVASIANYLRRRGWVAGARWGREVRLTDAAAERVAAAVPMRMTGACRAVREMSEPRPMREWRGLGVTLAGGRPLPGSEMPASLVRVDRHAFLVYANYEAVLGYNCAHTYALSVVTLADRLR